MTDYGAPFVGSVRSVKDEWIDYNGHFNMAYYGVLFDQCVDEAFELIGLGEDYVREENASFFTLETHTCYLRELHAGQEVSISVQILDHDEKRIHYFQEMRHAQEGWLAATIEVLCMHIDMGAKRASPFPTDMKKKLEDMHAAHSGLPVPEQAGRKVGIRRKKT